MARALTSMVKVAGPALSMAALTKAGPALCSRSSVGVQTRASTAQENRVSTDDIIDKIKHDHKELEQYFDNYKQATKKGDEAEARKWFNQFVWEISRHSVSEELVLYPMLAGLGDKGQKLADESREGHHKLKEILSDLQKTFDMEKFDEMMDTMYAELQDHIKLEEGQDLPYLQENTEASARETAGKTFSLGKNIVPTNPHPEVPEKLVALEAAVGLLIAPLDKFSDIFKPFPSKENKSVN
ncbi:hypothetical protein R1sor_020369 [Riccia sorocarpa]|uniref:Hemerythrin-like domain-containing protein n=1 Tax=Riccia sorocarpa TaxID=122646 RepID=A0ABD3IFD9_9MARC